MPTDFGVAGRRGIALGIAGLHSNMGILVDLGAKAAELTVKVSEKVESNWKVAMYAGAAYVTWRCLIKFETMRFCSQCIIPENCGLNLLKTIRPQKLEKPSVMIVAQQKCGSTLLCYIASLINVNNDISMFRNDFDLLPMLSFPTSIFPQNFNARQVNLHLALCVRHRVQWTHSTSLHCLLVFPESQHPAVWWRQCIPDERQPPCQRASARNNA
jgi:hypothetical protein